MRNFKNLALTLMAALILFAASPATVKATDLDPGKWAPENFKRIQSLISEYGNKNPNYDPAKKPYAVFDWDQTCIFNDTQEAMYRYMIENLVFKATPEEFAKAIYNGVPKENFAPAYNNQNGDPVNIDLIGADLIESYEFLYKNYIKSPKSPAMSLEKIRQTDEFINFRAKLAYLYEAIGGSFSADISYPWMNYLFVGFTEKELQALAENSDDSGLGDELTTYTLTSSLNKPGSAGVISLDGYKRGLRLYPEMANLMNALRSNGIDVYICSASHEAVVRTFAGLPKYGYNVPRENVIAMKTKMDKGKYLPEYDHSNDYPQTQGPGKTKAIEQILVKKYGSGPIMVAGDSQGDYSMATSFPDTKLTLILNRVRKDDFGKLGVQAVAERGKENARFILQGRNENIGQFRPTLATIKLGDKEEILLNKSLKK